MDRPKMLGERGPLEARLSEVNRAHVAPLTDLVRRLRARSGPEAAIPYFDPWDGGVEAEVLFLLEAPGPKARDSGFVSRNNPDETARNFFEISQEAGLDRRRTVTWNAVPWYVGDGTRIRPANAADVAEGLESTDELVRLLPDLQVIALVGRRAQSLRHHLARSRPDVVLVSCPHPSPMFVNRRPENRARILEAFVEIRSLLPEAERREGRREIGRRTSHEETVERNRIAWTENAYRAWTLRYGAPARAAARIVADPRRPARRLLGFMGEPAGRTVANPLGSHGRVATALALLGADVTVFDVSESNARYARELAAAAGVPLEYVVGDVQRTALEHPRRFDTVVMDLGIVHYFVDIDAFTASLRTLLKPGGTLVLSEFHPLVKKALDVDSGTPTLRGDYFATGIESAPVPYDAFTGDPSPACSLRRWNLGEIVTAFAGAGFRIRRLVEHPSADCVRLPGTFTLVATAD